MRLSATDAFFVAYQESSGVLMQLGVEVKLKGRIAREDVEQMLAQLVKRWPVLGQRVTMRMFGLAWTGAVRTSEMLCVAEKRDTLGDWRNKLLDPFREPPFQLMWIADGDVNLFAFRAHHAVVDGEGFFAVCAEALRVLSNQFGVRRLDAALLRSRVIDTNAASSRRTPNWFVIWKVLKEGRRDRSARLAVRSCNPGDIAIVERDLESNEFRELKRRAVELNVAPGWLCAAAWMRAIHAWNRSRDVATSSLISIEVPVSLRRKQDITIGNHISPVTLYGDATQPLEELAVELKRQITRAMRQGLHLAVPALSAPAKFLPWQVFRRTTASPKFTGFATSHFTWLAQSQSIHDEVSRASGGALQLVNQQMYAPVCLHMGAALAVLAWPERVQLFLIHRLTALSATDARKLSDLLVQEELGQRRVSREQIAV